MTETGIDHDGRGAVPSLWERVPEGMKTLARGLLTRSGLEPHVRLLFDSPLRDREWFECYGGVPMDRWGELLPWMPYSFIDFLDERLDPDARVFEYGSGTSTRWFAERVGTVVSVEDDRTWFDEVRTSVPSNAEVVYRTGQEYVSTPDEYGEFDLVVVDGRNRVECAETAADSLAPDGVIVWDDSRGRSSYSSKIAELERAGFRELAFQGMGPVTANLQRTSVLYRDHNCLGI